MGIVSDRKPLFMASFQLKTPVHLLSHELLRHLCFGFFCCLHCFLINDDLHLFEVTCSAHGSLVSTSSMVSKCIQASNHSTYLQRFNQQGPGHTQKKHYNHFAGSQINNPTMALQPHLLDGFLGHLGPWRAIAVINAPVVSMEH